MFFTYVVSLTIFHLGTCGGQLFYVMSVIFLRHLGVHTYSSLFVDTEWKPFFGFTTLSLRNEK